MWADVRIAAARDRLRALGRTVAASIAGLPWAEIAAAGALLAGWTLVTWAVASFVRTWQVWPFSAGLFLLSLFGWRYLWVMARDGLYALTRESRR